MTEALCVRVTAPVVSFRNPLYASVQVGLPCPPPSTVGGLLASTVGGWSAMPVATRFAMTFTARGSGTDLETYHPLDRRGAKSDPTPKDRAFLAFAELTVWLLDDLDLWERAFRRPMWPLRFGRSQDLAAARTRRVELTADRGVQGHAVVPEELSERGERLRLPTAISQDRARTRWGGYRYAATGSQNSIDALYATADGQAIVVLPSTHPATLDEQPA